jgi:hypothetical protein
MDSLKLPPEAHRTCGSCGAALKDGQEWCLQCGTGAAGSVEKERDWRPLAVMAAVCVCVLAGAATAAALALNQQPTKPPTHLVIAQVPPPAATSTPGGASTLGTPGATGTGTPGTGATGTGTTGTGGAFGTGKATTPLPSSTVKPPKLPAIVPTPHNSLIPSTNAGSAPTTPSTPATTPSATTPSTTTTGSSTTTQPQQTPNPILLDTDAASTYNPSGYPASFFGDPSLAIDGEPNTAWTAQVNPATAPNMAEGLALDLKSPTRVGSLEIIATPTGATVEVFGANGSALPATITDPAWTKLSDTHVMKKKNAIVKLGGGGKSYRFLVIWLVKAPAAAVGTPTAPGHVSFDEVVLYPPVR